jgi:hypothetical protein
LLHGRPQSQAKQMSASPLGAGPQVR